MNLTLLRSMMTVFENRLQQMERKVNTVEAIKGDKGDRGEAGIAGPAGPSGKQGRAGAKGKDGKDGVDGKDGEDGVGVESASIDLDGHLVFTLTDGSTLDAGSLNELFTPEKAQEVIHYVKGNGGSVDLTEIEERLDNVETKNTEQDQRLDALEASPPGSVDPTIAQGLRGVAEIGLLPVGNFTRSGTRLSTVDDTFLSITVAFQANLSALANDIASEVLLQAAPLPDPNQFVTLTEAGVEIVETFDLISTGAVRTTKLHMSAIIPAGHYVRLVENEARGDIDVFTTNNTVRNLRVTN